MPLPRRSRARRLAGTVLALSVVALASVPLARAGGDPKPRTRPQDPRSDRGGPRKPGGYSLEQATSDRAQGTTIAFDGLAFLTGSLGADTFLPPGKVCDWFGFQYMRDVDLGELGHNSKFLTTIADNVLRALTDEQKARLVALAREQAPKIEEFARRRFVAIKAFRRLLEGELPKGRRGLDPEAVGRFFAELYAIDGELAFRRAQVTGAILRSLDATQKRTLAALTFGDSRTWPDGAEGIDRRTMSHREHVAVMTYASEMFSWYAGSLDADVYFCPERHGTYFGGFYMKDMPAMRNPGTNISTALTGDSGEAFLAALDPAQRALVGGLVDAQRPTLARIVETRRAACVELRRFLEKDVSNHDRIVELARAYGRLDGELSRLYAVAFAQVGRTLTDAQRAALSKLRNLDGDVVRGAFLYSDPIDMPDIPGTDFLFGVTAPAGAGR